MRRFLFTLLAATSLSAAAPALADDYVMMKVNRQDITKNEVDSMWQGLFPPGEAPDINAMEPKMRERILRGIMTERLLLGEALKKGVDKAPALQKELEEIRRKLIVRRFIEAKAAETSEDELKDAYAHMVRDMRGMREVRARHILVASEAEARDIHKKLEADASQFAALAREYSKDPGSAKQGGDLGYFTKERMVKPFAEAAFRLKKGEISAPVQSDFGWHIIRVEDNRNVTIPTYNAARESLRQSLQEKKLAAYVAALVKQAEVTVYDAEGKEVSFEKTPADLKLQ